MTIIVAVRDHGGIMLGADNDATDGDRFMRRAVPKLWSVTPHIAVGTSGLARLTDVLRCAAWPQLTGLSTLEVANEISRHFVPMLRQEFDAQDNNRRIWALIAVESTLVQLSADLSVVALDAEYWSLGSGELVAMGALAAMKRLNPNLPTRQRADFALDACATHIAGIRPPWVFAETTVAQ